MFLLIFILATASVQGVAEQFEERFARLAAEDPATRGRDAVIADCQALIEEFPDRHALVALQIARIYDLSNPAAGFEQDRLASIDWYRQARDSSEPSSPLWTEASLRLAQRLREIPEEPSNVRQAREVLENLEIKAEQGSYEAFVIAAELVYQALAEHDLDKTEHACDQLAGLASRTPNAPIAKPPPDLIVVTACREFLINLAQSGELSKKDRKDRIEAFFERHKNVPRMDQAAAAALKTVEAWKDALEAPEPIAADPPGRSLYLRSRTWFLVGNGIAIVAIAFTLLVRKFWFQRRLTQPGQPPASTG